MLKYSFLVKKVEKHPKGYGHWPYPGDGDAFAVMYRELPLDAKYLRHFWRDEWYETPERGTYTPACDLDLVIPYGTLEIWIDVYCQ